MSGHNKWSTIKHKKEKTDAARGKIFTKIGREIAVAVKTGGSDPSTNSRLRDCIAKARANNMPNDNINRSIKKAAGELGSVDYTDIVYEGYGPGGVAVIVEVLTDNKNRTAAEIRHAFDKNGGSLGQTGCVGWMFDRKGVIAVEDDGSISEDDLMEKALEAGAEDFSAEDGIFEITTDPSDFSQVREALEKDGISFVSAEVDMIPQNTQAISDDQKIQIERMLDMLEDNDDVQNVYHNAEMDEE